MEWYSRSFQFLLHFSVPLLLVNLQPKLEERLLFFWGRDQSRSVMLFDKLRLCIEFFIVVISTSVSISFSCSFCWMIICKSSSVAVAVQQDLRSVSLKIMYLVTFKKAENFCILFTDVFSGSVGRERHVTRRAARSPPARASCCARRAGSIT